MSCCPVIISKHRKLVADYKNINNKEVYFVNENKLILCFDNELSNDTIVEIANFKPDFAVFSDNSFSSDATSINAEQIFKTYSNSTILKVI